MNNSPIKSIILITFMILNLSAYAQSKADRILGIYSVVETESKEASKVKIYKTKAGTYAAKVIWLAVPNFPDGTPKKDFKNPDPAKRNTPGDQIILMWDFTYDEETDKWIGGEIYDPVHGKIYKCQLNFETPIRLKVRGYIGKPAFGKSMYWNKL